MATLRGGDKLNSFLRDVGDQLASGERLRVGFLENATYPRKAKTQLRAAYNARRRKGIQKPIKGDSAGTAPNVPTVAMWNEFGTGTSPPRPFFRTMIRNKSGEWGLALAIQLQQTNYDVDRSLKILGEGIAGQLRQSIIDTNSPALAPSTIARKGFAKPLVDTAHMLMSVDYEVI